MFWCIFTLLKRTDASLGISPKGFRRRISCDGVPFIVAISILSFVMALFSTQDVRAISHDSYVSLSNYLVHTVKNDSTGSVRRQAVRLTSFKNDSDNPWSLYQSIIDYAKVLRVNGRQGDCVKFLYPVYSTIEGEKDRTSADEEALMTLCSSLGAALEEIGMQNTAMDYYMRGLYNTKTSNDPAFDKYRAMLFNNLGVIYYRAALFDKAREYFESALKLNLKLDNKIEIANNYNNIAAVFEVKDSIDRAIDYSLTSLRFIDPKVNPIDYYASYISLGSLYSDMGNPELGFSYLRTAFNHMIDLNYVQGIIGAASGLSDAFLISGNIDSARYYAKMAYDIADRGDLYNLEVEGLESLGDIAARAGDLPTALALKRQAAQLRDSVTAADRRQHLEDWESVHKARHILLNEKTPMSATQAFFISAVVALSIALIAFIIMHKWMKTMKMRVDIKLRVKSEETQELRRQLDLRNRRLTAKSISEMKLEGGLEDLADEIRRLIRQSNPKSKEDRLALQNLLKKIDNLEQGDSDALKEFHLYFEQVHSDFYESLSLRCPDLTDKEERLCAFLYLGLSTKEIADITYREVRSVESSRNRLRKKLGIDPDTTIRDFLRSNAG